MAHFMILTNYQQYAFEMRYLLMWWFIIATNIISGFKTVILAILSNANTPLNLLFSNYQELING